MFKKIRVGAIAFLLSFTGTASATDIVFMIDATSSMSGEIAGVRNGFSAFVGDIATNAIDARYAVVVYGGAPELVLDFTSDAAAVQTALDSIAIGPVTGFQNNHNLNPEAGLEAIRMVLGAAPNSNLVNNNIPEDGILNFRAGERINLILATDEDADDPFYGANRFPAVGGSGNTGEHGLIQAEVDATAQAVINNQAFVNMLIGHNGDSEAQYGDYIHDVSDANLLNFDAGATLANLLADAATDESLQAQVLGAGLIGRSFNVAGANDANFVTNFFAAKIEEIVNDPGFSVPEPGTLGLLTLGLLGIGLARRKKAA